MNKGRFFFFFQSFITIVFANKGLYNYKCMDLIYRSYTELQSFIKCITIVFANKGLYNCKYTDLFIAPASKTCEQIKMKEKLKVIFERRLL